MRTLLRSSFARLMLLAFFVAVDAALLRSVSHDKGVFPIVPALQAAVFLAFPRRGGVRPFWAGFLASGAAVLVLYSGVRGPFHKLPSGWSKPAYCCLYRYLQPRGINLYRLAHEGHIVFFLVWKYFKAIVVGLPLVMTAAAGGLGICWATARYRRLGSSRGGPDDSASASGSGLTRTRRFRSRASARSAPG